MRRFPHTKIRILDKYYKKNRLPCYNYIKDNRKEVDVDGIELKKFFTYNNSVYDIENKFKGLERNNQHYKVVVKPSTVAKMMFTTALCNVKSINELISTNSKKNLKYNALFERKEYVPKMHGLRDAVMDTDYNQIKNINNDILIKMKENGIFRKNTIDGLCVCAWDGVELCETNKNIKGLPEREHSTGEIRKYIKYEVAMNVGERGNYFVNAKQLLEKEKIESKTGLLKAKTIGETTAFKEMWDETGKIIGRVIDVHVFDTLYLNQNITNLINDNHKYFVIRLNDEKRIIYKDAKGLFINQKPLNEYELVEIIEEKDIKYNKLAKRKDQKKSLKKIIKRNATNKKMGEKELVNTNKFDKKNSTVKTNIYERIIKRKKVWSDKFELTGYKGMARVVRCIEESADGKVQEIYVVTNMLDHDVETIIKIMHYRWHIENNGFRKLKNQCNINHIFIGNNNAINYIMYMNFIVHNLLEVYMKFRLKIEVKLTYQVRKKDFEQQLHKEIRCIFANSS